MRSDFCFEKNGRYEEASDYNERPAHSQAFVLIAESFSNLTDHNDSALCYFTDKAPSRILKAVAGLKYAPMASDFIPV